MTNEEIIEKLGYLKVGLKDFSKLEAIDNAVDIISSLPGCKEDLDRYKKQLFEDFPEGSDKYFLVRNMVYEFEHILEVNFGKFEDW